MLLNQKFVSEIQFFFILVFNAINWCNKKKVSDSISQLPPSISPHEIIQLNRIFLILDDHLLLLARQMRAAEEEQNQTAAEFFSSKRRNYIRHCF